METGKEETLVGGFVAVNRLSLSFRVPNELVLLSETLVALQFLTSIDFGLA